MSTKVATAYELRSLFPLCTLWPLCEIIFRDEALSRRGGESCARRRRFTSAKFSAAPPRQFSGSARHQTRNRCPHAGPDHTFSPRTIRTALALRRRRNRGRPIERAPMGGRSARWYRELFLRHSAFLCFDRAAFQG